MELIFRSQWIDIIVRAFALLPYVYLIYAIKEERHG